jgi:hypothetical protein
MVTSLKKYSLQRKWSIAPVAVLLLLQVFFHPAIAQLRAGAASAGINPPIGAYVAGHTQNRKFKRVHDDIFVKAVVVTDGSKSITILTFDCIGLLYPQLLEIRSAVAGRIRDKAFDTSAIVMSSTHTHTGPDVVGLWGPDLMHSGVDSAYMKFLVRTASEQVVRAWKSRKRVSADYSVSRHGEGWVWNISQPDELDRSLTVLRFRDRKDRPVAIMTNFACHPTILDGAHEEVSSDYVAGYYQRMDSLYGGVNLFLQGAIGGWVQPEHEEKTFERALYRGRGIADAVQAGLQQSRPLGGNGVTLHRQIFDMPVDNPAFRQLSVLGVIRRQMSASVATEVAVFRIGDAMFATHPGETVPAMSLATKELMPTQGPKFVMGLGMDAMGYILKPEFFTRRKEIPHAEYLCGMSAGPKTSAEVMKVIGSLCSIFR